MVEFRLPDAGQLLILSVVPAVVVYHTYIRGDPPTGIELVFIVILYVLLVMASVIRDGIQSPNYLLLFGFLIAIFSGILYLQKGDIVSLASTAVGLLMLLRGIQLRFLKSRLLPQ
jgi:hypothetical protein